MVDIPEWLREFVLNNPPIAGPLEDPNWHPVDTTQFKGKTAPCLCTDTVASMGEPDPYESTPASMAGGGSVYTIVLSNGQTLSVYQGVSQPLNSVLNVGLTGLPDANSKITDFAVMTDAYIFDIVVPSTLTAGGFEIYDVTAGQRTSLGVSNLEFFTKNNPSRRVPPIGFRAGRIYRLIQCVTGNP